MIEGTEALMPGWGCHQCRVYNGLHRLSCKNCRRERCKLEIPETVRTCPGCGAGYLQVHLEKFVGEQCLGCGGPASMIGKKVPE